LIRKIKFREYEIELLDYMYKDEFKKCAQLIIQAHKANERRGIEILNGKQILPGISPITQMIQGMNQQLLDRQYERNFSYL
jgi:hypothetical protein